MVRMIENVLQIIYLVNRRTFNSTSLVVYLIKEFDKKFDSYLRFSRSHIHI